MEKRLTLSLLALISSFFLFVFATFAWLQVSQIVDIGNIDGTLSDANVEVVVYASQNGVLYDQTSSINIASGAPGNVYFFQVVITNTGEVPVNSRVVLYGLTNGLSDINGDDTAFNAGKSLIDVIRVTTSNDTTSDVIDGTLMKDLLPENPDQDYSMSTLVLLDYLSLDVGQTVILNVTFTLDGETGNDYQNLRLLIERLSVQSNIE